MLQVIFFSLEFVEKAFVSSSLDLASLHDLASASASIISSHVIAESSIILVKYFPFSHNYM